MLITKSNLNSKFAFIILTLSFWISKSINLVIETKIRLFTLRNLKFPYQFLMKGLA